MNFFHKSIIATRIKLFFFSALLILIVSTFSIIDKNSAEAVLKPLQKTPEFKNSLENNISGRKGFDYTFKISDKLEGKGEIKLMIKKNKIRGSANAIGKTSNCSVDFNTLIKGTVNKNDGSIEIALTGSGKPKSRLLPGKITYNGPLKGKLIQGDKNILLTGAVNIKGTLASLGGFKDKEDVVIEIKRSNSTNLLSKK